jgi:hypothetical protein
MRTKKTVHTATAFRDRPNMYDEFKGKYDALRLEVVIGDADGMKRRRAATYTAYINPVGDRPTAPARYIDGTTPTFGPYGWVSPNCGVIAANPMDGTYGDIVRAKDAGTWIEKLSDGDRIKVKGFGLWEAYVENPGGWGETMKIRKVR